jgi:hypothetical protein
MSRLTSVHDSVRVCANEAVDGLANQVSVPDVAGVFLDEVEEHPSQVGWLTALTDVASDIVEAAVSEGIVNDGAGACDGLLPECHEVLGRVVGRRSPFPVRVSFEVDGVPGRPGLASKQEPGEVTVLNKGKVLEQAAQRDRGWSQSLLEASRIEPSTFPGQVAPYPVQLAEERGCLVTGNGNFDRTHDRSVGPAPGGPAKRWFLL